jgi:aminoglycoside phosphotransferase (APT) family kinase protein
LDHRAFLRELFPELEVRTIVAIEQGWDSLVLEVNGDWIFRIPRRPQVEEWVEAELRLLPVLAPTLSLPVPRFDRVARNGVRCVGYRKLPGAPFDVREAAAHVEEVGAQLGRFLRDLHSFPPATARTLGVPSHDRNPSWRSRYHDLCAEFRERVGPLLEADERALAFATFERYLRDDDNFRFVPAVVHADLGPEHVLCAAGRVTGVIDWSDARIGDPALDFAWLLHGTPPPVGEAALGAYGSEDPGALRERARFYHVLGPWYEVHYGLFTSQPRFVRSGLDGIRRRLTPPLRFCR